ncbi:unnamed protein product [Urochloa humidicola]
MLEPPCWAGHRSFVLVAAALRPPGASLCGVAGHHRAPSRASRSMLRQLWAITPPYPRPSHFDGRTAVIPPGDLASSPRHASVVASPAAAHAPPPPPPSPPPPISPRSSRWPQTPAADLCAARPSSAPAQGAARRNPAVGPRLPRFRLNAQRLLGASSAVDLRTRRGGAALRGQQQGAISVSHPRGPDAGALDLRGRQRDRTGEVPG